jgi:hypothetical protein
MPATNQSVNQVSQFACHIPEICTISPIEHFSITQGKIMSLRMIEAAREIATITKESLGPHFIERSPRRKQF